MASAFHAVSILSSRPGRTRADRAANSAPRAATSRVCASGSEMPSAAATASSGLRNAQVPGVALEVRRPVEPEVRRRDRVLVGRERRAERSAASRRRTPFLALAVGVEARVERAVGRAHLARQPADDAARDVGERGVAGRPREIGVEPEQRPVVVEHLLEVRDRPLGVHAVAAEAAAQLVVDAAVGHRGRAWCATIDSASASPVARVGAQAEIELDRVRELGRPRRSRRAPDRSSRFRSASALRGGVARAARPRHRPAARARASASCSRALCSAIASPCSRYAAATRGRSSRNPGRPCRPFLREIGAAEERLAVRA